MSAHGAAMAGRSTRSVTFVLWAAEPGDDFERIDSFEDKGAAREAARDLAQAGRYEFFRIFRGRKLVADFVAGQEAA